MKPLGNMHNIAAGDLIFSQGDTNKQVGFIVSGNASACINSEHGDQTWVEQFCPGDFFGHIPLLTQSPIELEIKADSDMIILFVPARSFERLLSANTDLSIALSKSLAARLSVIINRLFEAMTLSSPGRVCAELLRLSHPIGIEPNTYIIRPVPTFVDIALRVNSTRETVSRTVSGLQKSGVLSREPGALIIYKPDGLRKKIR